MRILEDRPDRNGELAIASRTMPQSRTDLLRRVGCDVIDAIGVGVAAMRTDGAARPANRFKIFARRVVSREALHDLIKGQIGRRPDVRDFGKRCHTLLSRACGICQVHNSENLFLRVARLGAGVGILSTHRPAQAVGR